MSEKRFYFLVIDSVPHSVQLCTDIFHDKDQINGNNEGYQREHHKTYMLAKNRVVAEVEDTSLPFEGKHHREDEEDAHLIQDFLYIVLIRLHACYPYKQDVRGAQAY